MSKSIQPVEFFAKHPVFRYEEFVAAHSKSGQRSPHTSASVLKQHADTWVFLDTESASLLDRSA